jgi:hypothetical protein
LILFLITGLVFSSSIKILSQTENEIKNPDKYLWGAEATGMNLEDARFSAKRNLINYLFETVITKTSRDYMELNEDVRDYKRIQTKSFSSLTLKGIQFFERKSDDSFNVFAYMSKSDYNKSLELIAIEIRQSVKIAESKERDNDLSDAALEYYFAYLKSFLSPEPISYESTQTSEQFENINPFLRNKIETFLSDCEVVSLKPKIDSRIPEQIVLPFKVSYLNHHVNDITLQLNIPNEPEYLIKNGVTDIYLDFKPSFINKQLSLLLSLNCNDKIYHDSLIIELDKYFKIKKEKTIEVDFSSVIRIDFNVIVKNGLFSFKPIIENLSVFDLEWDFGDGTISREEKPALLFNDKKDHIIKLTLNRNDHLSISKIISPTGNMTVIPKSDSSEKKEIVKYDNILDNLIQIQSFKALEKQLILYKNNHKLMFSGSQSDFIHPENCYVFIINTSSGEIVAILDKGISGRKDLLSGEIVYDLGHKFSNNGILWVDIY